MCTARPGWQSMSFRVAKYKRRLTNIHINLVDILEVNAEEQWVRVEPLVTMGQLSASLDPLGWSLPIVPELDDLTVGGLVMGTGVETSSHKYGLFQHICVEYELVLADGSVATCSKNEDPDLFYAVPWSYGTLGFLVSVKLKIIPSTRFVRLEYVPVKSTSDIVQKFQEAAEQKNADFVEGIMFSPTAGVIMKGQRTNIAEPGKLNDIGRWYQPWFFKHVESFVETDSSSKDSRVEYIPSRSYFHRHSRSIFWELQDIVPFGNNLWFRLLCGWMVPPKISLLKLTQTSATKRLYEATHVIQDMLVPVDQLDAAIRCFHENARVYPVWLCPFNLPSEPGMLSIPSEKMYVDIGLYGVPGIESYDARTSTRKLEEFVREVKGFQMLYADSYMTRDEFRTMFNHDLYDKVRKRLDCFHAFPEVYDKINVHART
ncbi:unnamed protein product [Cyprideis torosa]|uniref:Delta(24)-sterol reductase n=1 Tax=Cyprideis torosa TaxID=163714 RepID=A0A7R8ZKS2_9CRUS|nr:unnamed protein product [Cyprideis torosa]CAG0890049.1 unnamed protein product [Cyprideis torosa]